MAWDQVEEKRVQFHLKCVYPPKERVKKDYLFLTNVTLYQACEDMRVLSLYEDYRDSEKYEDLTHLDLTHLDWEENSAKILEEMKAYAYWGKLKAISALSEMMRVLLALDKLENNAKNCKAIRKLKRNFFLHRDEVFKGVCMLNQACLIGKASDEAARLFAEKESKKMTVLMFDKTLFSQKFFNAILDSVLFKIYRFLFLPKQIDSLETQIEKQNTLRKRIDFLIETTSLLDQYSLKRTVEEEGHFHYALALILSIINKQQAEVDAYVKLSELHDAQLMLNKHKFLNTRFREICLLFIDKELVKEVLLGSFTKVALLAGEEGIKSAFALCQFVFAF